MMGTGFVASMAVGVCSVSVLTAFGLADIPTVPAIIITSAVYFSAVTLVINIIKIRKKSWRSEGVSEVKKRYNEAKMSEI